VVEENVQQAPAQVQVEEFRVIKRFAPVSETTPFMRREEFGTRQQEGLFFYEICLLLLYQFYVTIP
jgi:hypothetical protein